MVEIITDEEGFNKALEYDAEIQRLMDEEIPDATLLDHKFGLEDIRRQHGPTNCLLISGLLLEKKMVELGINPKDKEERKSFLAQRKRYECAEVDRIRRYGEAETDIVIPQYVIDSQTKKPKSGPTVTIWRENKLDSYVQEE